MILYRILHQGGFETRQRLSCADYIALFCFLNSSCFDGICLRMGLQRLRLHEKSKTRTRHWNGTLEGTRVASLETRVKRKELQEAQRLRRDEEWDELQRKEREEALLKARALQVASSGIGRELTSKLVLKQVLLERELQVKHKQLLKEKLKNLPEPMNLLFLPCDSPPTRPQEYKERLPAKEEMAELEKHRQDQEMLFQQQKDLDRYHVHTVTQEHRERVSQDKQNQIRTKLNQRKTLDDQIHERNRCKQLEDERQQEEEASRLGWIGNKKNKQKVLMEQELHLRMNKIREINDMGTEQAARDYAEMQDRHEKMTKAVVKRQAEEDLRTQRIRDGKELQKMELKKFFVAYVRVKSKF
jgi:hypothetical protein